MIKKIFLVSFLSAYSLIAQAAGIQIFGIYSAPEPTLKENKIFNRKFDIKEYVGLGIAAHFKLKRRLMVEGSLSVPDFFRNGSISEHKTIISHAKTGIIDPSVKWIPRLPIQLPYVTPYVKAGLWFLAHGKMTSPYPPKDTDKKPPVESKLGYGVTIGIGSIFTFPFLRKLPLELSWAYHQPLISSYLPKHSCEKGFSSIRLGVFYTF